MRGWIMISVLALAGCNEHMGANVNYRFGDSPYGQYLTQREAALIGNGDAPATIPVARPLQTPTPEQIAGASPVPVPATMGVTTRKAATRSAAPASANANAPMTANSGPYPGSVPVLARYAAQTRNDPGRQVHARSGGTAAQAARVCAEYASPEAAQTAFLAAGGPQADPHGMDPDGDGFVCGWDPRPLRRP